MSKLIIGVDVSKDTHQVLIKAKNEKDEVKIKGKRKFDNSVSGHAELLKWVNKRIKPHHKSICYVMEATGVYYEDLAHFLYESDQHVSVLLPNKVTYFAKSLNIVSKNDEIDARIIAQIGMERTLEAWKPISPYYSEIKALNRKRLSLVKERKRAKNQLHAMNHAHKTPEYVIQTTENQIKFYERSILALETEIETVVKTDPELDEKIDTVATIKGIGRATVITLICETNGFFLVRNIRQLVSYSGLDIVFNQSGNFEGKTRISKRGNARIRECLYMPALTAKQHNTKLKALNDRVVAKNPKIKQKGTVACMRKLLILVYTLWKKNEAYDPSYEVA